MLDTIVLDGSRPTSLCREAVGRTFPYILSLQSYPTLIGLEVIDEEPPSLLGVVASTICSYRLKKLKLHSTTAGMINALFRSPARSFDHLEELDLRITSHPIDIPQWAVSQHGVLRLCPPFKHYT